VLQVVGERTALQRNIILERMLALIAQFVPSLIRNDIINKSTSLTWIWHRVRKHYSFAQSEVNFLKLSNIKRESDKRYETFFQRIIAHLEDNLLTVESGLLHDGALPTSDKEKSPTLERLAVYMWLTLIDERLPAHISRAYTHDLQKNHLGNSTNSRPRSQLSHFHDWHNHLNEHNSSDEDDSYSADTIEAANAPN